MMKPLHLYCLAGAEENQWASHDGVPLGDTTLLQAAACFALQGDELHIRHGITFA